MSQQTATQFIKDTLKREEELRDSIVNLGTFIAASPEAMTYKVVEIANNTTRKAIKLTNEDLKEIQEILYKRKEAQVKELEEIRQKLNAIQLLLK